MMRPIMESFGLKFSAIGWEEYDFAIKEMLRGAFNEFLKLISKRDFSIRILSSSLSSGYWS